MKTPTSKKIAKSIEENWREAVQHRAYELFLARGQETGRELDDWLQAESEIRYKRAQVAQAHQ